MSWSFVVLFFVFAFAYRRVTRAGDRLAEYAATGMLRSPLYHAQTLLPIVLLGFMFAPAYLPRGSWAASIYLLALGIDIVALLLVRRALKWRYPI